MTKDEIKQYLVNQLDANIPFNKLIGIEIVSIDSPVTIKFPMNDKLIGNSWSKGGKLHGGVIASALDFVGGLAAGISVIDHAKDVETIPQNLLRMGTVDLRIDYLRSARGKEFIGTATILRTGNRIAVTRMELYNDADVLLAAGTASYVIG